MKRDALVAALQALDRADDEIMKVAAAYEQRKKASLENDPQWTAFTQQTKQDWMREINDFDDKRVIVKLVCTLATINAMFKASNTIRMSAKKLFDGEVNSYDEIGLEIRNARAGVFKVAREELGFDPQ